MKEAARPNRWTFSRCRPQVFSLHSCGLMNTLARSLLQCHWRSYLQGFQHFFQHFGALSRFCSHGPELCHPRLILFQVCGGHGFRDLFECYGKVLHGHGHLQLFFGQGPDLLRAQALDSPSHRHHGGVSDEESSKERQARSSMHAICTLHWRLSVLSEEQSLQGDWFKTTVWSPPRLLEQLKPVTCSHV